MTYAVIKESEFIERLIVELSPLRGKVNSVMGKGRSGAIASSYASHYLHVPYLLPTITQIPKRLRPLLVIDTAIWRGRTLRKLTKQHQAEHFVALYKEPPMVKFWYEFVGIA